MSARGRFYSDVVSTIHTRRRCALKRECLGCWVRWVSPDCQAELVLPATRFAFVPACLALQACAQHNLDGIVIIGGDDSNTNAAVMAEHFLAQVRICCRYSMAFARWQRQGGCNTAGRVQALCAGRTSGRRADGCVTPYAMPAGHQDAGGGCAQDH